MTPQQTAALEGVVGRRLTTQEIEGIEAHLQKRDDVAIAGILSAGRTRLDPLPKATFQIWLAVKGIRAVVEDHCNNADSPLRSVALTIRDFMWGTTEVIHFDLADNQMMVAAWVAGGGMTAEQGAELLALGSVADPIHFDVVSRALNIAEGRLML